ncbi:hypothetical protein DS742_27195 [Lacrimispora amygdalina]|uniref:Uncharacterized protein n=1 Tax=Lacrimispora amygdalina TaxID=253257 RepID=A0A3E2N472_9FIRM|nr:hypothetical protein DS742_27195 [Clostridium indicum]
MLAQIAEIPPISQHSPLFFVHSASFCRYFWYAFYHFRVFCHINLILAVKHISKLVKEEEKYNVRKND